MTGGTRMVAIQFENKVRIPAGIDDLESFRRWARSDEFPERGRFAYLNGELFVDLSMEDYFPHTRVKTEYAVTLFPEPDSPTTPRVSPGPTARSTPSTARMIPSPVKNWVLRLVILRRASVFNFLTLIGHR